MDDTGPSTVDMETLVARLDALTSRLDAQAAVIAEQQATIARLTAAPAAIAPQAAMPTTAVPVAARTTVSSRRGMLARVLGATAAAAVLTVARDAATAEADTRTTLRAGGASTASYGLAASYSTVDPATLLPDISGSIYGVVGVVANPLFTPPGPAGVLGCTSAGAGVIGVGNLGYGVQGVSLNAAGVRGTSTYTYGTWGYSSNSDGVLGSTDSNDPNVASAGVHGLTTKDTGYGVFGRGPGVAIYGISDSPASAPAAGIRGESANGAGVFGTSTRAFGVQGASQNAYGVSGNSTTQAGVWGSSNTNVGVLGSSTSGVGVNGVSVSSNGVNGLSTSGIGVYGSSPQGTAGRFDGNVVIIGNLTVSGNFPHTAAVPSSDGTLRRLFSLGSAEAYYEDLGQGSLTNGVGTVTLDPAFAALVRTDAYQVFLTAYGDNRGLYVSNQTASGFDVREVQAGTSSIGFGYRVVARPRDLPTSRLDQVTLPPTPAQPKLDRIEPLDVPATLRDLHQPDQPSAPQPAGPPPRVQDGR